MDYSAGIAAEARTLVVVPTMLSSARNVEDLVEALEVRFLANRDARLHFGLLTDFLDAAEESLPADEVLLRLAEARINELNDKYVGDSQPTPVRSICFTVRAAGMRTRGSGWATNANAASLPT